MADFQGQLMLESKKGEKTFRFYMPIGAPLGECYDACFEFLQRITEAANKAVENTERKEVEEKPEENIEVKEKSNKK